MATANFRNNSNFYMPNIWSHKWTPYDPAVHLLRHYVIPQGLWLHTDTLNILILHELLFSGRAITCAWVLHLLICIWWQKVFKLQVWKHKYSLILENVVLIIQEDNVIVISYFYAKQCLVFGCHLHIYPNFNNYKSLDK